MARQYLGRDGELSDGQDSSDDSTLTYPADVYYTPRYSALPQSTRYHHRPLIDYVKNEWKTTYKRVDDKASEEDEMPQWVRMIMSMMAAPRFRRYVPAYLFLLVLFWTLWKGLMSPRLKENAELMRSLDPRVKETVGGWFGANSLPEFDGLVMVGTMNPLLLPADVAAKGTKSRRLIFVGDVHGCKTELDELLEKVSFNHRNGDHLIFTGDMISKGPASLGVVDLARRHSASCVRGNHDDRVLLLRRAMHAANDLDGDSNEEENGFTGNSNDRKLARELNNDQAKWLDACPVILNVGRIGGMGQVVVVHGGLVPGIENEKQDPSSVMNMRTIELQNHVPSASQEFTPWSKLFNKHQSLLYSALKTRPIPDPKSELTTVIYGHDSASSPLLRTYTKGIDTGCYKGGKLSALVIENGGNQHLVQVKCRNYKRK